MFIPTWLVIILCLIFLPVLLEIAAVLTIVAVTFALFALPVSIVVLALLH